MRTTLSALAQLMVDWRARGWSTDDLAAFRMEAFPSVNDLSRMSVGDLEALVKRADVRLRAVHQRDDGTPRTLSPAEQSEFNVLVELRDAAQAHAKVRASFGRSRGERAFDAPNVNRGFDLDADPMRMGNSEVRDIALAALERREPMTARLRSDQLDQIDAVIRADDVDTDGSVVARRILVTENPAYRSAWRQVVTDPHPALTPDEVAALRSYRDFERWENRGMSEASGGVGSYGIPVFIDPSIILTAQGSDNPFLQIARQAIVTTNKWRGVSSAGVSWSFDAEGSEVSDDSPTLVQPTVDIFTARGFIPFSIELGQDYVGFAEEMAMLLGAGYDELLLSKFTTGNGTTEPTGLLTKLDATPGSEVLLTTAGSFGAVDLYKAWKALPQRWRRRASFMSNVGINSTARQFSNAQNIGNFTVDLTAYSASTIFGRPVYENDYFPDFTSTTGHENAMVIGSFGEGFLVARRAGMSVELVPHLFSTTTNLPNGQRGWFSWARVGSDAIVPQAFVLINQT